MLCRLGVSDIAKKMYGIFFCPFCRIVKTTSRIRKYLNSDTEYQLTQEYIPVNTIPQTLNDALIYWATKNPGKIFIQTNKDNYSFRETKTIAESLSGFLTNNGISAGAIICLLLPRTPELIFSFLAASLANFIPAPVNYLENTNTIKEIISSLNPAVIIVDETVINDEIKNIISVNNALVISTNHQSKFDTALHWDHCINQVTFHKKNHKITRPNDIAYFNYTTGSSGFPKGALCTHANLFWNTRSAIDTFQLTEHDVHLCMFASFAHPHELFCRALFTGASLVLLTEISPKSIVNAINKYQVTCMMGLAVMYKMMAEHCGKASLSSLRIAESGGMFTNPETHISFLSSFHLPILSVWGSTETSGIALANSPESYRLDGSMGKACPHYQVKLVDKNGEEVPTGDIGELIFSSPAVVSGYHNNVSFPSEESWYFTGDLAIKDKDDFYHFVERKSGMIKVAGLKVYPLQVELILQKYPYIKEVAVVGVQEKRRGYVPKAYIVTENSKPVTVADLRVFCKNKLAPYMIPKHIQQVTELPKIGSGKINKKALLALN